MSLRPGFTGWNVIRWRRRKSSGFVWPRHHRNESYRLGGERKDRFLLCTLGRLNEHCLIDVIDGTRSDIRQIIWLTYCINNTIALYSYKRGFLELPPWHIQVWLGFSSHWHPILLVVIVNDWNSIEDLQTFFSNASQEVGDLSNHNRRGPEVKKPEGTHRMWI